jgi:tRNA modification GTPase
LNIEADTIVAIATPPGRGGIGVVRVSGPHTPSISNAMLGRMPQARRAVYSEFLGADGTAIDRGIALYFPKPHSFTGEHVLELQGHGGPVVLDMLVNRVLELGARLARPGEFSERAFLNGKLDLAQAEAVADLIESGSQAAARSAMRSLQGEFSQCVHRLVEAMINLRMYVEAAIDFPEEEVDFLGDQQITDGVDDLLAELDRVLILAQQGCLLRYGMRIVLAGPPNAGKSSLLNVLAQVDRAIVSETPGTTRDIVDQHIQIDGLPLHLLDTAGLRDAVGDVEHEGISRARAAMQQADRVLVVVDDSQVIDLQLLMTQLPPGVPATLVRNKIDLSGRRAGTETTPDTVEVAISAKTGAGLDDLKRHLKHCMGYEIDGEPTFIARRRHLEALNLSRDHVLAGKHLLVDRQAGELLAEELRLAQQSLSEITGEFTSDDLLGRIFSAFCIGK